MILAQTLTAAAPGLSASASATMSASMTALIAAVVTGLVSVLPLLWSLLKTKLQLKQAEDAAKLSKLNEMASQREAATSKAIAVDAQADAASSKAAAVSACAVRDTAVRGVFAAMEALPAHSDRIKAAIQEVATSEGQESALNVVVKAVKAATRDEIRAVDEHGEAKP